jgi:hypothetical protein
MNYLWGRIKTVKLSIGGVGVAGCDFNFATAANQNEQGIDCGSIIPANARVLDVYAKTETAFTGAVSLTTKLGTASGGTQFSTGVDIIAANAFVYLLHASALNVAPNNAATKLYVSATPGANWSNVIAGKMNVYLTYIETSAL